MKRVPTMILMIAAMAVFASVASACPTHRADRREAQQHTRIAQGVRNGELTRVEARRLRAGQRHVHRVERRAKADGNVTPSERLRIEQAQDRESRAIYRLKHNARTRKAA